MKPTETPTKSMPLLVIEAKGEIVSSNFDEFDAAALQWLADINRSLATDEEFDQAAEDVKKCKTVEDLLVATRDAVLEKAEIINAELTRLSGLGSVMRDARLELSRQIEKAKADQRERLVDGALTQLECDRTMRLGFRSEIEAAIKGKKTGAKEAVRIALAVCNDRITRAKKLLDAHEDEHGQIHDRRNLEVTDPVALEGELRRRVEAIAAEKKRRELEAEAVKARQEAEQARREAAKARLVAEATTTPQAAPEAAEAAPWATSAEPAPEPEAAADLSERTELREFLATARAAFVALKEARLRLVYPANVAIASDLAEMAQMWYSANIAKVKGDA